MKTTKAFRIQLLIALIVFICGVSLMGMIYIAFNQPDIYVSPGIVTAPSPVATPVQAVRGSSLLRSRANYHVPAQTSSPQSTIMTPAAQPEMKGLWTTSSSQIHAVGGGAGVTPATTSRPSSSSSRGIKTASGTVVPITTFVSMASTRQVAPPAAMQAPQMAKMATTPNRVPPPPPNGETPDEHQLTEQPIGTPWVLALFALIYAISVYFWRTREQK